MPRREEGWPTKGEEEEEREEEGGEEGQKELGEGCLASLRCQGRTNPSVQNRIKTITLFVLLFFSNRVMIDLINICFCAWTLSYPAKIFYSHIILVHISQILPIYNVLEIPIITQRTIHHICPLQWSVFTNARKLAVIVTSSISVCSTWALHQTVCPPAPTSQCPVRISCSVQKIQISNVWIFSTGVLRHICEWIRLHK